MLGVDRLISLGAERPHSTVLLSFTTISDWGSVLIAAIGWSEVASIAVSAELDDVLARSTTAAPSCSSLSLPSSTCSFEMLSAGSSRSFGMPRILFNNALDGSVRDLGIGYFTVPS